MAWNLKIKNMKAPIFTFVLFVTITIVTAYTFNNSQKKNESMMFDVRLEDVGNMVHRASTAVFDPIESVGAIMAGANIRGARNKTAQFHHYIESRQILKAFPNVGAIVYAPKLAPDKVDTVIKEVEQEVERSEYGYPPIKVYPPIEGTGNVVPVTMFVPAKLRNKALGFNIFSRDNRRIPAERAALTGKIQLSSRLVLRFDEPGVVAFNPVYRTTTPPKTIKGRKESHVGYTMAVYTTRKMLLGIKEKFDNLGLDVDVHDFGPIDTIERPDLDLSTLLSSTKLGDTAVADWKVEDLLKITPHSQNYLDIEVGGNVWRVVVDVKDPVAFYSRTDISLFVMIVGSILAVLAAIIVHQQRNSASILATRVNERTQELQQAQTDLEKSHALAEQQARTDPLTGLYNRRAISVFYESIKPKLSVLKGNTFILLFDIDYFKSINDTRGHDIGDKILIEVANIVRQMVPDSASIARLGGDEFAALLPKVDNVDNLGKFSDKILEKVEQMGSHFGLPSLSLSMGLASVDLDDDCLSQAMKRADIALYEAKSTGRGRLVYYTDALGRRENRKITVLKRVSEGLKQDGFIPHYHSFVDLESNKVVGFEVLARWQHPKDGLLTPAAFWEALCDDVYATQISEMVMRKSFREVGHLIQQGYDVGRIAINATENMLKSSGFSERYIELARINGLGVENLKIEVTERILLARDGEEMMQTLRRLSDMGVSIAFDDFGTGYASLTHLRTFPIDSVKLDMSFVKELETDHKSRTIVAAVVNMAHELGIEVTAEGIEGHECVKLLRNMNCDLGQGFLYGKPMGVDAVRRVLAEKKNLAA